MENLKICLISDTVYDVNGVSRFIQDFAKEALAFEKPFFVITSTKKEHYEKIENVINLKPLITMKMPFYKSLDLVIPSFFKIYKKIKEINPTLLHISTPGTVGLCALISAKLLKIPVVGIYHTDFPSYLYKNTKSKFVKNGTVLFLKLFYKGYKAIFLRSEEYSKIVQEQLNLKKENLFLVKAGINIKSFDKTFKDETIWDGYQVQKDKFKVLYVGRLSVEKGVDTLISYWNEFNLSDCELILVGDLEFELNQKELKNIKIIGRKQKEDLSKLYASSDCFIFPSTTDTLGQVVMEALSSALPVIVTNQGGPKTFVSQEFGYILDFKQKDEVKKAILELKNNKEIYDDKSTKAYEFMRDMSISHSFLDFWSKNEQFLNVCK
jgi:glycosyltransferase involved in cell wall biosynthesis